MLSLEDYKSRVVGICEEMAGGLPYETDQIDAEDWQELAEKLRLLASHVGSAAARLAAYAGNASKRSQGA